MDYSRNVFSQNGEDGIIERIFEMMGTQNGVCCEFGAWDGVHLSNTRNLILKGWTGVLIEANMKRYESLKRTYRGNTLVHCINKRVDVGQSGLAAILREVGFLNCDFLSIDIDGLDYEIMQNLEIRPRVVCIEAPAGHSPEDCSMVPRDIAMDNVGQPLCVISRIAEEKGYKLVCYTGNAFYVRNDIIDNCQLRPLSDVEAYQYFLSRLPERNRAWLFLANKGIVNPYHEFHNRFLSLDQLGLSPARILYLVPVNLAKMLVVKLRIGAGTL